MNLNKTVLGIFFGLICAVAIFAGLWGFFTTANIAPTLSIAVILLVAAQLLLFFLMSGYPRNENASIALEEIKSRLGELEQHIRQLNHPQPVSSQSTPELPTPATNHEQTQSARTPQPEYLNDDRLMLYLEPVVEFNALETAFYRAELILNSAQSGRISVASIADEISANNHSAAIDMKLFNRLGPVIDRLAEKGRLVGIICPMSKHSFSNQQFLEELTVYLKQFPGLARVLVIEISQANLAGLSKEGMAGLAFLAQIGATFSLGRAGLESPDLASLSSLGFRYLDLDYTDNVRRYGLEAFSSTGEAANLRQQAGNVGIQLIGSGLVQKTQYQALSLIIQFGRGRVFSPPRLVRNDVGRQTARTKAA